MKKIIKMFSYIIMLLVLAFLILSLSTSMAVRLHMTLAGHPVLALMSNPKYDPSFSKDVNKEIYSVNLKYGYSPMGSGDNKNNAFEIHKVWLFKVATPIANVMY